MQIRLYSRQDDKEFRKLMQSICQSQGNELDLDGKDNDLRNVEGSYFGNDGLFLVAEDNGVIQGFCGARIEPGTKVSTETLRDKTTSTNANSRTANSRNANPARDTMCVKRLYVSPEIEDHQALAENLLNVVKNHAYQLDFETILLPTS